MKRYVRVTDDLFDQLALKLPSDRAADGTPSVADFVHTDLAAGHAHFADQLDNLPEPIPGRPDYRTHISRGTCVAAFSSSGQLAPDGRIELVDIEIDLRPADSSPDED